MAQAMVKGNKNSQKLMMVREEAPEIAVHRENENTCSGLF